MVRHQVDGRGQASAALARAGPCRASGRKEGNRGEVGSCSAVTGGVGRVRGLGRGSCLNEQKF